MGLYLYFMEDIMSEEHEEDSQIEGVLGDLGRIGPEYDHEKQAAQKEKFLKRAVKMKKKKPGCPFAILILVLKIFVIVGTTQMFGA